MRPVPPSLSIYYKTKRTVLACDRQISGTERVEVLDPHMYCLF